MPSHDHAQRRRSQRRGRERGCWVYIPAEYLEALGLATDDPPPFYRLWSGKDRPRVIINLYREA